MTSKPRSRTRPTVGSDRRTAKAKPARGTRRGDAPVPGATRAERIALGLLLLSPLAIVPGGLDRFVFGKLLLAAVAVTVAAFAPARGRLPREITALVATGAAVLVVAAALSAQPLVALLGRAPRYEGVLVLTLYVLTAWAGARLLGPARPAATAALTCRVLAWVAVALAAVAVLEALGLRPLTSNLDRPGSLAGNASDEGALAVLISAPLALEALRRPRPWTVTGLAAAVLTAALSASRGALIGLIAVAVGVAVVRRVRPRWLLAGAAAVVALVLVLPGTRDRVLGLSTFSAQTAGGRVQLWTETLSLWTSHPVFGVGPSGFVAAIPAEHTEHWYRIVGPAFPPDSPHSWPLQLLDAGGPILLAVGVAVLVLLVRSTWAARREPDGWRAGAGLGVLGYATCLMFHFTSPGPTVLALALAGAVLARSLRTVAPSGLGGRAVGWTRRVIRPAAGGLAALLGTAFLLAAVAEVWVRVGVERAGAGDARAADQAFGTTARLRPWDVDLPVVAAHAVLTGAATETDPAALDVAGRWLDRARVRDDDQLARDRATWDQRRGDLASAESTLTAALADDPANPLTLQQRGIVRAERREFASAEADLRRVAAISPASPEPWSNLASVYEAWGRPDDAARAQAEARARGG